MTDILSPGSFTNILELIWNIEPWGIVYFCGSNGIIKFLILIPSPAANVSDSLLTSSFLLYINGWIEKMVKGKTRRQHSKMAASMMSVRIARWCWGRNSQILLAVPSNIRSYVSRRKHESLGWVWLGSWCFPFLQKLRVELERLRQKCRRFSLCLHAGQN